MVFGFPLSHTVTLTHTRMAVAIFSLFVVAHIERINGKVLFNYSATKCLSAKVNIKTILVYCFAFHGTATRKA